MKAIILCAGYATRLYPLTENTPKPLLKIGDKPIIEYIIKKIEEIKEVDEIFIVTNTKFFKHFLDWNSTHNDKLKISIVNDNTTSNDDRLGSLGDIRYVVENLKIVDDVLVIAGDNLFEFSLVPGFNLYRKNNKATIILFDVGSAELAMLYGIVSIDENNKIIDFEEKPKNPKSTLASTGVYFYPKEIVNKLINYTHENNTDRAGDFLQWLYKEDHVFGISTKDKWFDIGNLEQLETAKIQFLRDTKNNMKYL